MSAPRTILAPARHDSERNGFLKKFSEFRKRLMPEKGNLPPELADGLDIQVSAALDLLRVARNDAGHPKQAQVGRDDCFVNLRIFPRMAARMYTLKEFFEKSQVEVQQ